MIVVEVDVEVIASDCEQRDAQLDVTQRPLFVRAAVAEMLSAALNEERVEVPLCIHSVDSHAEALCVQ